MANSTIYEIRDSIERNSVVATVLPYHDESFTTQLMANDGAFRRHERLHARPESNLGMSDFERRQRREVAEALVHERNFEGQCVMQQVQHACRGVHEGSGGGGDDVRVELCKMI